MADYTPPFTGGVKPFTKTTSGTVVGGTLVTMTGDDTVAASTTGDHPVGVAGHDAVSGAKLTVWPIAGCTHEVTCQGVVAIAANNPIIPGTTGFINTGALATVAAAGTLIGICTRGGTGGTGAGTARFMGIG
jgi:hypothetical protein